MDELEISGKRYISTRRAAREHGYHSDYMGQLIRGKKVVGQKVGRAWYIEEGSLNAYLGNATPEPAVAQAPQTTPVVEAPAQPARIERLVVEEPVAAPVVAPAPVQAAEPVYASAVVEPAPAPQPIAPRAIYNEPLVRPSAPASSQHIEHVSYAVPQAQTVQETRIPIHTSVAVEEYAGGLRYADDDTPSIPAVTRMPQEPAYYPAQGPHRAHASSRSFPYVSLSIVAVVSIVSALFASNFITATIVSEEGKSASVQYSIHW